MPKLISVDHKNGTNFSLTIEDDVTTVGQLRAAIADRLNVSPESVSLGKGPKFNLNDDDDLSTVGIVTLSTVSISVRTTIKPYANKDMAREFAELLMKLQSLKESQVIFIGLGCYDHDHGLKSIQQQQCPPDVLNYCLGHRLRLSVILIDTGFEAAHGPQQIYDIDTAWILDKTLKSGLRRYRYSRAKSNIHLYIFPMHVEPETYAGSSNVLNGIDLTSFREPLEANGGCLICGNFYDVTNKANLVVGDQRVIGGIPWLSTRLAGRTMLFEAPDELEDLPLIRREEENASCCPVCIVM